MTNAPTADIIPPPGGGGLHLPPQPLVAESQLSIRWATIPPVKNTAPDLVASAKTGFSLAVAAAMKWVGEAGGAKRAFVGAINNSRLLRLANHSVPLCLRIQIIAPFWHAENIAPL